MSEWGWCDSEMRKKCKNYPIDCDHCTRNELRNELTEEPDDFFEEIEEEDEKDE